MVVSNIHAPSDSTLLWDSVRVLARILKKAKELFPRSGICFQNHTPRAKRRMLNIQYTKTKKQRKTYYQDLLKVAHDTVAYSRNTNHILQFSQGLTAVSLGNDHDQTVNLALRVIQQTEKRVLQGASVPSSDRVVSIFEPHTDIIVKNRRDTFFNHKVCLTGGRSNLITDCTNEDGNPADTDLVKKYLDRQNEIYSRYPLKVAFDGGFASKENLDIAKGIQKLRHFRAGIEAGILWIKRCFGFARCTWKGLRSFKSYVWSSTISANLLKMARKQLA